MTRSVLFYPVDSVKAAWFSLAAIEEGALVPTVVTALLLAVLDDVREQFS